MIEYVLFFALVLSILPKRNIEGIKKDVVVIYHQI